jgi:hypothetical protein
MARIRTIKPHFFKSQDVTELSYQARLTWIGLWTYVDDAGRGRDDARLIKGELWPLEDDVTWQDVERVLTELSLSLHVVRYTVENRHFLAIPKWLDHQVISRPSISKFPAPTPENIREVAPLTEDSVSTHGANTAGTGNREQGKGTGKGNSSSSEVAVATSRPEIDSLLDLLDFEIEANGGRKPSRTKRNTDAMRLLVDNDDRQPEDIAKAIRWCQRDEFWRGNILSASKLRDKYDQLRLAAQRTTKTTTQPTTKADLNAAEFQRIYGGGNERAGSIRAIDSRVSA